MPGLDEARKLVSGSGLTHEDYDKLDKAITYIASIRTSLGAGPDVSDSAILAALSEALEEAQWVELIEYEEDLRGRRTQNLAATMLATHKELEVALCKKDPNRALAVVRSVWSADL